MAAIFRDARLAILLSVSGNIRGPDMKKPEHGAMLRLV